VPGDADVEVPAGRVRLGVADATTGVLTAGLDPPIGAESGDEPDPADAEADELDPPTEARVVGWEAAGSWRLARHPTKTSNVTPHKTRSGTAAI